VLARPADVARLAHCAVLAGLVVRTGAALDVSALRTLTAIRGDLVIGPTVSIEDIAVAELRIVDGAIRVVGNGALQRLRMPKLERAGRLEVDSNPVLATLSLPRLAEVRGSLQVTDNAGLELVDLSGLTSVGQALVLTGDPSLAMVDAGALRTAGRVEVDLARLSSEQADQLRAAAP
jgi:hypothetical protein